MKWVRGYNARYQQRLSAEYDAEVRQCNEQLEAIKKQDDERAKYLAEPEDDVD